MTTQTVPGLVLAVDDDPRNLQIISRLLSRFGHTVITASNGEAALDAIGRQHPDVILLDVVMPGLDGFETCRRIKANEATRLTPVVLLTGLAERADRIEGITAGADEFVSKPFDPNELVARVHSLLKLKRYTDELESATGVILSLARTVEARDSYTLGHCQRLSSYGVALGRALGMDGASLAAIDKGGFLHDVGKIGIPDAILLKPGRLTAEEFETIKGHTLIGERLCGTLRSLAAVRAIIRWHHERLDGSGYPDGLKGDAIPLTAQIIGIVDIYDAMTTTRPYRPAQAPATACAELRREAARGHLNPRVVDAVVELVENGCFERIAAEPGE